MKTSYEIYDKYFGTGFSQDPVRLCAIRAFCAVSKRSDGYESLLSTLGEDVMRDVLDDEDYALWREVKGETLGAMAF